MTRGCVNAFRLPTVALDVLDSAGARHRFEAVVDSGFTGFIALPSKTIAALQLPPWGISGFTIADGSEIELPMHVATIVWEGRDRLAFVVAIEGGTLIGMSLLAGKWFHMHVVVDGEVIIGER